MEETTPQHTTTSFHISYGTSIGVPRQGNRSFQDTETREIGEWTLLRRSVAIAESGPRSARRATHQADCWDQVDDAQGWYVAALAL